MDTETQKEKQRERERKRERARERETERKEERWMERERERERKRERESEREKATETRKSILICSGLPQTNCYNFNSNSIKMNQNLLWAASNQFPFSFN